MTSPSHPYTNLTANAFWKKGVAELNSLDIDLAWKPKFPITRQTGVITIGSCFAQHISKSLKKNGFNWIDSEPAPMDLRVEEYEKNNYGVFSFRTGNIYTAGLLRQWIHWAFGAESSSECFQEQDRYFDPFRPSINENGYVSPEHMMASRQLTLDAIRNSLQQADLFVFTLGLTEAWMNRNGVVYPMCPGTIRGTFDQKNHVFHNYDYTEIVSDLQFVFDSIRKFNPKIRFLLTVSPVPLTATAAGEHVLTATTYSKSVLRAAAGYLAKIRDDTDYFPSYEIITAPAFKGQFFEDNMRSVRAGGVAFVMGQFLKSIGVVNESPKTTVAPVTKIEVSKTSDEICDDIILESWSNGNQTDENLPLQVVFIGDSHIGKMALESKELNLNYVGGGTMNASDWHAGHFDFSDEFIFLPHKEEQKEQWKDTYQASFARYRELKVKPLIVTNLGQQRNEAYFRGFFEQYVLNVYGPSYSGEIKKYELFTYLMASRTKHIRLICLLLAQGYKVLTVSDPPVDHQTDVEACTMVDDFFVNLFESIGCITFNARLWMKQLGSIPKEYYSTDNQHAGDAYYLDVMKEIISRHQLKSA